MCCLLDAPCPLMAEALVEVDARCLFMPIRCRRSVSGGRPTPYTHPVRLPCPTPHIPCTHLFCRWAFSSFPSCAPTLFVRTPFCRCFCSVSGPRLATLPACHALRLPPSAPPAFDEHFEQPTLQQANEAARTQPARIVQTLSRLVPKPCAPFCAVQRSPSPLTQLPCQYSAPGASCQQPCH